MNLPDETDKALQALTQMIPTAIFVIHEGHIRHANTEAEVLTGYPHDELAGMRFRDLVHPDFRSVYDEMGGAMQWQVEMKLLPRRGDRRWVRFDTSQIELDEGTALLATALDISETKHVLEALRINEERFRAIFEHAAIGIAQTGLDMRILRANRALQEMLGYSEAELQRMTFLDITHPDDREKDAQLYEAMQAGKRKHYAMEKRYICKNGKVKWGRLSASLVRDDQGKPLFAIGMVLDITESKQAQEQILEAERLRINLDKERELVKLKEAFVSMVSHEFRNPLTAILSSGEMLQRYAGRLSLERQQEHIQRITSQAQYMTSLLNDILVLRQSQEGALQCNPAPLDLAAFCRDLIAEFQQTTQQFVFTSEGDFSDVMMDSRLLHHILGNLLSNAVKYTPDEGKIRLEAYRDGDEVVFKVIDNGIGIAPDDQERLLEPFHRGQNVGDIGGTGLGLTIAHDSVRAHGGTLSFESAVGKGATFIVRLPLAS